MGFGKRKTKRENVLKIEYYITVIRLIIIWKSNFIVQLPTKSHSVNTAVTLCIR